MTSRTFVSPSALNICNSGLYPPPGYCVIATTKQANPAAPTDKAYHLTLMRSAWMRHSPFQKSDMSRHASDT